MTISITPPKPKTPRALGKVALKGAGYLSFFLFCFTLFSYWFFPYDQLRDYILQKFNQPSKAAGSSGTNPLHLKIADLGPWRLSGAHLRGVELIKVSSQSGKDPIKISIDELWARVPLFSLLSEGQHVSFEAAIGSGEIDGTYHKNSEELELSAEFDQVDAAKVGLGSLIGLPVKGLLNGSIELKIPTDIAKSRGKILLSIAKLTIGDGKAKFIIEALRDGVTIDAIDAGDLQIEINVKKGVAKVAKLTSQGKDLQLEGSGTIRLAKDLSNTTLSLLLEFTFSNGYKQRSNRTRALFSLMDFEPTLKKAMSPTGALRYQISGRIANLRALPAKSSDKVRKRK